MPALNGFELFEKMKNVESQVQARVIATYSNYRDEFRNSFPMLDEATLD
jgi:two-component SAPR family response regulator